MDVSLRSGAHTLSRGLRTSSPAVAALGAALLALAYLRNEKRDESRQVIRVRPGEAIRVVVTRRARANRSRVSSVVGPSWGDN